MSSKRNGKIELLRFFFCISVLLFHAGSDVLGKGVEINRYFAFFERGRTGVEFFFLLSGFLAAKSALTFQSSNNTIGSNTFNFIFRKIKTILPYHIFAVILSVLQLYLYSDNFIFEFANRFPGIFFLQRTGISNYDLISVEWYICSMLLALAVIYPLMLKNYDMTTLVFAPVASSLMIGYMIKTYGTMPSSNDFETYTYSCNIRAFALILLGCFCFRISEKIKAYDFSRAEKNCLIVVENVCWIISVYYVVSKINQKYVSYVIYFMALGITLTFAGSRFSKLYNNEFVYYLGKLSLPIYLCQNIARNIVKYELSFLSAPLKIIAILLLALLLGILSQLICGKIKNIKPKNKKELCEYNA